MGAVMELTMHGRRLIRLFEIEEWLGKKGLFVQIERSEVLDDWAYEHQQVFQNRLTEEQIDYFVQIGKIVLMHGVLQGNVRCGYAVRKIAEALFELQVWFDSERFPELDDSRLTAENRLFYEEATVAVMQNIASGDLLLAGLGSEIVLHYKRDVEQTMREAHGVVRWIVSCAVDVRLDGYQRNGSEVGNDFLIWDRM